ncbi:MAG: hypothetical protein H6744_20705 [Deltaproteobacteria bacterium]|nr:hypothetical protein [Deltaproteobacteria bacterium]
MTFNPLRRSDTSLDTTTPTEAQPGRSRSQSLRGASFEEGSSLLAPKGNGLEDGSSLLSPKGDGLEGVLKPEAITTQEAPKQEAQNQDAPPQPQTPIEMIRASPGRLHALGNGVKAMYTIRMSLSSDITAMTFPKLGEYLRSALFHYEQAFTGTPYMNIVRQLQGFANLVATLQPLRGSEKLVSTARDYGKKKASQDEVYDRSVRTSSEAKGKALALRGRMKQGGVDSAQRRHERHLAAHREEAQAEVEMRIGHYARPWGSLIDATHPFEQALDIAFSDIFNGVVDMTVDPRVAQTLKETEFKPEGFGEFDPLRNF